eukprot:7608751-Pyramimonas_sp.AAC.1
MLHPLLSPAIIAVKALASPFLVWSPFVRRAVAEHFKLLGLTIGRFEPEWGLQVFVDRNDSYQILQVTAGIRRYDWSFWTSSPSAAHVLRAVAR